MHQDPGLAPGSNTPVIIEDENSNSSNVFINGSRLPSIYFQGYDGLIVQISGSELSPASEGLKATASQNPLMEVN